MNDETTAGFEERFIERFNEILKKHVDEISAHMNTISTRLDCLSERVAGLSRSIDDVDTRLVHLSDRTAILSCQPIVYLPARRPQFRIYESEGLTWSS